MAKARVLAVDDQRYFRELIEGLLSEEGYAVQTAASAEDALHLLEREPFDIVVTDLVMPDIDGTQLVEQIKQRLPEQEIVMVTGVVDVQTAVQSMKQGATDYILKPFGRKELTDSLERILQRRRLRDEHARLMAENLEYMGVLSLYERAIGLFSTLALQPLADRLIESLCLETRAQGGVLWVAEDLGESRLVMVGARGLIRVEEESEELVLEQLGEAFVEQINEGRSVVMPHPGEGSGQGVALYVPIRSGSGLLGVARLSDPLDGRPFGDHARAAAEKFIGFGTNAIVNALRFRALERRSFRDPTTRTYTDAYFRDAVRNEIQKASRFGRPFSVVQIVTGPLGDLRRRGSDNQFTQWVEELVEHIGGALRGTDLLASESESRYRILLPETDAVGASVLSQRVRDIVTESDLLGRRQDERIELIMATASYPGDGTQLESLERVLAERVDEHRDSLLRSLDLAGNPFSQMLDALVAEGDVGALEMPGEIARFVIDEVERRPRDRGLLFVSPGARMQRVVCEGLERLRETETRTEIILVEEDPNVARQAGPVTRVTTRRAGTARPFLVYYGDGPAYAMVTGDEAKKDGLSLFHTSDRALVEQLALQLQRDLGLPLGAST
ncbi:MAG: response regulator [Deltaproteobacteria bacterium]|nr:response regulator [Deltaproteobacteria bacterium]